MIVGLWPVTELKSLQAPSVSFWLEGFSDATVPSLLRLPFNHRRQANRNVSVAERHGPRSAHGISGSPIVGREHTSQGRRHANKPDVVNNIFVQSEMVLETPACSGACWSRLPFYTLHLNNVSTWVSLSKSNDMYATTPLIQQLLPQSIFSSKLGHRGINAVSLLKKLPLHQ